ncbi:recombinase family protein [Streptomyces sp. NRRL S-378]|uniref:recombinase family protein n=1 Tax=Streptomyces sp. NRRL S-378 TaxID=1463904 RepID=UPI0004C4A1B0|nr:recombinase family protein [Streptomyces sp. NRRL S-378]
MKLVHNPDEPLRAFTYSRISRVTERTTSIARQTEHCAAEVERRGWRLLHPFADEGVSGATDPDQRPQMSVMMSRLDEVDAIVFYKLDRLSRSTIAFADLMERCEKARVSLVSVTEPLDLSSPMGVAMAEIIAVFAKLERAMIRERSMDARRKGLEDNKFVGGRIAYGLTPAPHPSGKGRYLVRDPEAVKVIQRMAAMLLDGESTTAIAKALNEAGVPTSRQQGATAKRAGGFAAEDTYWRGNAVRSILRNPVQLGHRIGDRGRPVTGPDGLPVVAWEPVFTWDVWQAVQAKLDTLSVTRTRRLDAHWLQGVALCGTCDAPLTQTVAHGHKGLKCSRPNEQRHRPAAYIRANDLSEWVDEQMTTVFAPFRVVESIWHPGSSSRQERLEVASTIKTMRADRDAGLYVGPEDEEEFRTKMTALLARRAALEEVSDVAPHWELRDTGRTFGEVWESAPHGRRAEMLADAGLVIRVDPAGGRRLPVGERARIEQRNQAAAELEAVRDDESRELTHRQGGLTQEEHEEIERDLLEDIRQQELF